MALERLESPWTPSKVSGRPGAGGGDGPDAPGGPGSPDSPDFGDADVAVEEGRPKLAEPPKYAVVLHNDDYTTMEFVVEVLQKFFRKNADEAVRITMQIHQAGRGIAGIYSFEIAETKVEQVTEAARGRGYPLKCTAEKV